MWTAGGNVSVRVFVDAEGDIRVQDVESGLETVKAVVGFYLKGYWGESVEGGCEQRGKWSVRYRQFHHAPKIVLLYPLNLKLTKKYTH